MSNDKINVPEGKLEDMTIPDYCREYLAVGGYWPVYRWTDLSKNTVKGVWNGEDRRRGLDTVQELANALRLEPTEVRTLIENTKEESS